MKLLVIGAGALGVHHALAALDAGWEVVVCERDRRPRSASVRNFGLVWCSGRVPGPGLDLALEARRRWEKIGAAFPEIGFRPAGSLTLARRDDELAVLEEYMDHAPDRGLDASLLTPSQITALNPAIAGDAIGAVLVRDDAVVEPRRTAPSLLDRIEDHPSATVHRGCEIKEVQATSTGVRATSMSLRIEADVAVACPGADHAGPFAELLAAEPLLDRCQLDMFETEPLATPSTTAFADGDSLRYYPGFSELPSAEQLAPPEAIVAEQRIQLLVAPRLDGALTVGDSHRYDEPFPFDTDERVTTHLLGRLEAVLGAPPPPIRSRWTGVYSRYRGDAPYLRLVPEPGIHVVTGVAGKGMTVSPAVAAETMEVLR